jgi:Leucine-rich repeat (LRR) protein
MKKTTSQKILDMLNEAKFATMKKSINKLTGSDKMPIATTGVTNQDITDIPNEWKAVVKKAIDLRAFTLNWHSEKVSEIPDIVFDRLSEVADSIEMVDLSDQLFSEIPEGIKQFKNVVKLYLHHNKIKALSPFVFNFKRLETLHISHNLISEIPSSIGKLENLKFIEMQKNKITELPDELSKLKKLVEISYDGKLISHLPITNPNVYINNGI